MTRSSGVRAYEVDETRTCSLTARVNGVTYALGCGVESFVTVSVDPEIDTEVWECPACGLTNVHDRREP